MLDNRCKPTWYIAYQGLLFDGVIKKDFMYFNCIFYEIVVVIAVMCMSTSNRKKFSSCNLRKTLSRFEQSPIRLSPKNKSQTKFYIRQTERARLCSGFAFANSFSLALFHSSHNQTLSAYERQLTIRLRKKPTTIQKVVFHLIFVWIQSVGGT